MTVTGAPEGFITDWSAEGSGSNRKIGVLLVHGFTGSPASMRPWAQYLNDKGYSVRVPLLPGHGTAPHDLNKVSWSQWTQKVRDEFNELSKTCDKVFICGLSMGGGTSLNFALDRSKEIAGLILVNPMIHVAYIGPEIAFFLSRFQKLRKSVGDDIKKPGVTEYGYDALPTRGVVQLLHMLKATRARLGEITAPLQLFHSVDDHTLPVSNTEIIFSKIGSSDKQRIELTNSYHVATLDYDAEIIFENSRLFIEAHSH